MSNFFRLAEHFRSIGQSLIATNRFHLRFQQSLEFYTAFWYSVNSLKNFFSAEPPGTSTQTEPFGLTPHRLLLALFRTPVSSAAPDYSTETAKTYCRLPELVQQRLSKLTTDVRSSPTVRKQSALLPSGCSMPGQVSYRGGEPTTLE